MEDAKLNSGMIYTPIWRYDENKSSWKEFVPKEKNQYNLHPITMVTWNVMIDIYETDLIYSQTRWEYQLKYLEQLQPDVICLNEVQPKLLEFIISQDWIRKKYFVSDLPKNFNSTSTGNSVEPFGNVILSKLIPNQSYQYHYLAFPRRPAVIMTFLFESENDKFLLGVSSVHLSAKAENISIRRSQLFELYTAIYIQLCVQSIPSLSQMFVMGDFNFHDEKENALISNAYDDVWTKLYKGSIGFTFDAEKNTLIQKMYQGKETRRMRLDRIITSKPHQNSLQKSTYSLLDSSVNGNHWQSTNSN